MKYIKLFLIIILFSITNVNASTISYNWNIDSNKKIHENSWTLTVIRVKENNNESNKKFVLYRFRTVTL